MKTRFIKECTTCEGTGREVINNTWDHDPRYDQSFTCESCHGEGSKLDYDQIEDAVYEVEDMIDGMIARIRVTSDNIKLCAKLECHNLVARYKNTLNTQARGLARLESYCVNLKTFL